MPRGSVIANRMVENNRYYRQGRRHPLDSYDALCLCAATQAKKPKRHFSSPHPHARWQTDCKQPGQLETKPKQHTDHDASKAKAILILAMPRLELVMSIWSIHLSTPCRYGIQWLDSVSTTLHQSRPLNGCTGKSDYMRVHGSEKKKANSEELAFVTDIAGGGMRNRTRVRFLNKSPSVRTEFLF